MIAFPSVAKATAASIFLLVISWPAPSIGVSRKASIWGQGGALAILVAYLFVALANRSWLDVTILAPVLGLEIWLTRWLWNPSKKDRKSGV